MPTVLFKRGMPNARKDMELQAALSSFLFGALLIFWPGNVLSPAPAFRGLLWYGPPWALGVAMILGSVVQFCAPYYPPKWRIGVMAASIFWYFLLFINAVFSPATADPAAVFLFAALFASVRSCGVLLDGYRA